MSPIASKAHDNPFYESKNSSPKRLMRKIEENNRFNNISTPTKQQAVPTETTAQQQLSSAFKKRRITSM